MVHMLRIPARFLGLMLLGVLFGAGCLPGRGDKTPPTSQPTPVVEKQEEPSTQTEPSDPIEAEAYDDAALTAEEDRLLEEVDRAGALHDADVGSLEDSFAEEGENDTRSID